MEKVEALDLLEESWFFENLFDRRRRMLRCYSDPCTSSNFRRDVSANDSGRKMHDIRENRIDGKIRSRGESSASRRNLLRTPSLPCSMGTNVLNRDKESDVRMSKLIRQAMANTPDILPPRHSHNKPLNCNANETAVVRGRYSIPKSTLLKSHSDLAIQELQGFKDLGFTFDNQDLSPDVVNILPGLQGTTTDEPKQEKARRKPYLSEAWHVPRPPPPPPLPPRVSKNSAHDMKAQIKFWARAVATNVRQEC
ncbi:hypothetical protein GQ457_01G004240 [Hibiscus cannabinus]